MDRPTEEDNRPRAAATCSSRFLCGGVVAAMIGASFAAVPFYSWFCRTTGYGGTTQVREGGARADSPTRTITVRFDSNVAAGLPWRFEPERRSIDVKLGEVVTVYYAVTNEAARATIGAGRLQCQPADGRHLLREDQLLLLHRADA